MSEFNLPITFEPLFMERVWGGRKLESIYRKRIPAGKCIGESWEIVDRPEAQSIVRDGPLAGRSLHDLWVNFRAAIFGKAPDAPRFPLLIKLLDCREKLSLQVHPPAAVARMLGSEPKTEAWVITDAAPDAELWLGLREPTEPQKFADALDSGQAAELVRRVPVKTGDAFFIPGGRMHAIGGGNLIVEVQQNSDTTYRIFDWNRKDEKGQFRELHIAEAMRCIDFEDCNPTVSAGNAESLVADRLFAIDRWKIDSARELSPPNEFAIAFCLRGEVECAGSLFQPGEFFLLPAHAKNRTVKGAKSELLRITIPSS
ncbi:MAG TPA: type I phosphomannose isomerase catalytic subunit [Chthoniobacterales bacterium]|jgi:mannose-6-phosphate isomerase